jgi:transcriptional regulator with XRE-family HTH domain
LIDMASVKSSPKFREWLAVAVPRSGLSKREIARRMAATHPRGVTPDTIETGRRTINKILSGDLTPTQPTRDSIAAALERDDAPSVIEDEEEEPDLEATLQALAREQVELGRRLARALKSVSA